MDEIIANSFFLYYTDKMEIVDINEALELVAGEKELLNELLVSYVNDRHFSLDELDSLKAENPENAAGYVHYFKGAARQLCAKKTAFSGQILEDILRKKSSGDYETAKRNFASDYEELCTFIKGMLND